MNIEFGESSKIDKQETIVSPFSISFIIYEIIRCCLIKILIEETQLYINIVIKDVFH